MKYEAAGRYAAMSRELKGLQRLACRVFYHSAPVLFGLKPAVLINMGKPGEERYSLWIKYASLLSEMMEKDPSLETFEMMERSGSLQIYVFHRQQLTRLLSCLKVQELLSEFGYGRRPDVEGALIRLKKRFLYACPHEIGILLGYPPEDVRGFIQHAGRDYLLNGYWKVYHAPNSALQTFEAYDCARERILDVISLQPPG